jgi:hypothetical protein
MVRNLGWHFVRKPNSCEFGYGAQCAVTRRAMDDVVAEFGREEREEKGVRNR